MSEYPINSTAKIYYDADENQVTLRQLIKLEPEWAHSRIKICEQIEKERDQLKAKLEVAEKLADKVNRAEKLHEDNTDYTETMFLDDVCEALANYKEPQK